MAALTAAVLLAAVGCAGDRPHQEPTSATAAQDRMSSSPAQQAQKQPLARLTGQHHLTLTITVADRDPGGFLTVRGALANEGTETAVVPAELRGNERTVLRNGQSLGGATLVDFHERKRYYVLRDAEGRPLTTTGLKYLKAGESVRVFMQFPAPPATTTEVDFQLPQFDTATIRISP
ncbi:hypothetical protein [Streptomyces fulvoviolaceus]|uniref:hypothetical protein n=1 Tax=Streptomyces fulvoviolaceus TaxID=285535 RepID=UPI0006933BBA|nr:hypothetical protein [Streptomyces fulvoviolaceus]